MKSPNTLPTFVDDLLRYSWDELCFLAYDGFTKNGRGVVVVFPEPDGTYSAGYAAYDLATLTDNWAYVVRDYEPETEFVLQFMDEAQNLRTVRIKTPPNAPHPKRVWFFRVLEETSEDH